jgi:hypothetical protein
MTFCECGCGQEIVIKYHHRYYGIPRFISGHQNRGENNPSFGKNPSEETRKKMGDGCRGKFRSEEFKKNDAETHRGEKNARFGKPGCWRGKKRPEMAGENNPNFGNHGEASFAWKGGWSSLTHLI